MTLRRTVSAVLAEDTVLEIERNDRMYRNVYDPQVQYAAGIVGYVTGQLGLPIASTARWARSPTRCAPRCTGSRSIKLSVPGQGETD